MSLRNFFFASLGAFALNSCTTVEPPMTAEALLVQPYALKTAEPFDVAAYLDLLPDWVNASFGEATFDPATGAMVINDLFIAPQAAPNYGVRIDRAEIWSGDVAALEAVKSGNAVSGALQLLDRASFQGIRSEGLQWENGAQSISFTMDKAVIDGLAAQSFSITPKEGEEGFVTFLRTMAALSNSYALDGMAYANMALKMNESQGAEILVNVAQGFVRGYDSGRMDYERVEGLAVKTRTPSSGSLTQVAERIQENTAAKPEDKILQPWMREELARARKNPIAFIAETTGGQTSKQAIDVIEVRNSDLAGALKWLATWELPPITETNLIDLGSMVFLGNRQSINGTQILSVDRSEITVSDFYWLIPSDYEQIDTGFTMAVGDFFDEMMSDVPLTADNGAQELLQFREAITALGLETVRADARTNWNWNGETGALNAGLSSDVVDLASGFSTIALGGPSLVEWDALLREGASSNDIIQRISLGGFTYSVTDEQVLDRVFAYAATQMGGTGEDLRQSLPAMVRLSGAQVAAMNPRISAYVDAVAEFLSTGGTLEINMAPTEPVSLLTVQTTGQQAPQTLPDVLNLTVTHTPR